MPEQEKDMKMSSLHSGGNLEDNIHSISEKLKCHDYPPDIYHHFYVYEPKLRKVIFSDYTTKVIQRAAYNVLNPIVCKGMISDTYSCIEDRGQLKSMQRLAGWVDFVEKSGERWYYLKMDVEKFFYRMDHEVLMSIIRKKIGDKEAVRFLEHYVCHASRAFGLPLGVKSPLEISDKEMLWDVGIAIGGGLSHMYGNMYLNPMDQMAKRKEGIQYYIRYMDDVIILSTDKELLHRYKNMFSDFLGDVLKLRLNNKTAIRPVSHGMEFVGYTIRPFDVRLRKSTSLRMKRHLKTIQELYRDYEIDLDRARSTLMSYKALMDHCDCRASKSYLHHEMDRGAKLAGVKRIKIHGLRHSHISLLIHMGYSALAIAERVGHEAVDITYHYAHLFPTVQSDMAVHLDSEREELINVRKK